MSAPGPCPKCPPTAGHGTRFAAGERVEVFDRNGLRRWRPAIVERDEPYHGARHGHISDGARIQWADLVPGSYASAGGWVHARDIRAAYDIDAETEQIEEIQRELGEDEFGNRQQSNPEGGER